MLRPRSVSPPARRGVILLVVVILLALFAVVGLTFVLYAEAEAVSSRVHKEAETPRRADAEPELLLSYFLSQLIYDVPDARISTPPTSDPNNSISSYPVNSAMRGNSLVRSMTGYYDPASPPPPGQNRPPNDNFYNGIGRIHTQGGFDEADRVNFMDDGSGTVWDPERPTAGHAPAAAVTPYVGGFNPSYTYPDANSMFLASMRPSDGAILMQSFHRTWLGGKLTAINSADPRKHLRAKLPFAPENDGGDVKNYMDGPGFFDGTKFHNNDSIWMDLGYPVKFAPDGKRYKPLFAPLVLDLDSRLNLVAHGNIRGANNTHISNQGFGPWEVNLTALSNGDPAKSAEWANLFLASQVKPDLIGRYGGTIDPKTGQVTLDRQPSSGNNPNQYAQVPPAPRFFSQVDFDGDDTTAGGGIKLPTNPRDPFPTFGAGYGNFSQAEITNHPGLYNPNAPMGGDKDLGSFSNMEAIFRFNDTGSHALTSNLFQFLPKNLGDPADGARIRRLITLLSSDIDQPAPVPWVWDRKDKNGWLTMPQGATVTFPTGNPIGFPTTQGAKLGDAPPPGYGNSGYGSEFGPDWKAAGGRKNPRKSRDLGRLDLNRNMPDFVQDQYRFPTQKTDAEAALVARQLLARDIFQRLCFYTNAPPCVDDQGQALAPKTEQPDPDDPADKDRYDALRWLAQLAVNMVDYIDDDDIPTAFNWNTNYTGDIGKGWVFGTELPRVLINEAYAEYTAVPMQPNQFSVNVGVKLLNPFKKDALRPGESADDKLTKKYRIVLCKPSVVQTIQKRDNPLGTPDPSDIYKFQTPPAQPAKDAILTFDPVQPNGPDLIIKACDATAGQGYFWVSTGNVPKSANGKQPDLTTGSAYITTAQNEKPVFVLQRLMFPGVSENSDSTSVDPEKPFNPWITVDYMENVPLNDAKGMGGNSRARKQPYGGSQTTTQTPAFVSDNSVSQVPDWLVHLDRQLVSVPEVFMASMYSPALLTHQFDTNKNGHSAAPCWFNEQTRLYRVTEMLTTHRLGNGYMASPSSLDSVGTTNLTRDAFDTGNGVYQCGIWSRYGTTRTGTPWSILVGSRILVGTGQNAEMVEVVDPPPGFQMDDTTIFAKFKRAPQAGAKVQLTTLGDRLVGRININTLQPDITGANGKPASTVFRALCDAQAPNYFTQAEVDEVFADLIASRTQDPNGIPGPNDRPFLTPATGVYPANDPQFPPKMGGTNTGIEDTIFRSVPAGSPRAAKGASRLFDSSVAPPHEYLKKSLLTKIYSNLTLRSNVFAVWVTVGFFEVTDAKGTLGQEIGKSEGRNIRHRMFSIVDRSAFAKSSTTGGGTTTPLTQPITPAFPGGGLVDVYPQSMTDVHEGFYANFSHAAQSNSITATGVQQPDLVMMTGFQHKFDAGAQITFTATVPQWIEPGHLPKLDQNGVQIRAQQTFTATVVTPITTGSGLVQLSDPSLLQYVKPGSTKVTVSDTVYYESVPVTQVLPAGQKPKYFTCTLSKVYNTGDLVTFYFPRPAQDPYNPGPQILWNTRDDRGINNPILYFSVID